MFPILSIITFLPLLGGVALLFFRSKQEDEEQTNRIRWTALGIAGLQFLFMLGILLTYLQQAVGAFLNGSFLSQVFAQFSKGGVPSGSFLFAEQINLVPALGISYSLGIDGLSLVLVALTSLLTVVCIAASFRIDQKVKNYMIFMLLLESGIIGVFLATNLFLFYIFWEVMLIPAYFLVGTWGGERRISATFKFMIYTAVGSLLMLVGIIALGYYHQQAVGGTYTLNLVNILSGKLDPTVQTWLFLAFAAAFAVKVPLVPFHNWLPDAYSEAPFPVTAMLAGAMSNAGAYGFLRFCLPLFPQAVQKLAPVFSTLAVVSILYCAILALVQTDIRRLLAYSSISQMGIVMLGIFAFNQQGIEGAVLQMVNHGITIVALFIIVGFIETRVGTRRLSDFRGLAVRIPVLATVMLIAVLSSLGLPGLNSFTGEFLALLGVFRSSVVFGVLGTAVVIPAAWYLIRFFQGMMEGPRRTEGIVSGVERKGLLSDLRLSEFLVLLPLLALIIYIGIQPQPLTFLLELH